MSVNISGLDKAMVLKALYDRSHIQGLGYLQAVPEGTVTIEYCRKLLDKTTYFDYLHGRILKVDLSEDEFDELLYDRDNYQGAAKDAVQMCRDNIALSYFPQTMSGCNHSGSFTHNYYWDDDTCDK